MSEHKILLFILSVIFYCLYSVNMWFTTNNVIEEEPPKPKTIVEKQPELKPNISSVKHEVKTKVIPLYLKDACSALEVFTQKPHNYKMKREYIEAENNAVTVICITVFLVILLLNALLDVLKVKEEERARRKLNPNGERRQSLAEFANKKMLRRESSKFGLQLFQIAESVVTSDDETKSRREIKPYTRGDSINSYLSEKTTKSDSSAPASIGEISEPRAAKRQSIAKLFDNALQWLPQRPVYNYYHCEFRFWRNSSLKTIPYTLWYHMFRGQQTRSLDIGCLSPLKHQGSHSARCVLQLNQYLTGCNLDLNFPTKYNHIFDKGSSFVPSLFELSKRKFYEIINESAKKFTKAPISIYTDVYHTDNFENNYNIRDIQESLNGFNINNNNNNVKYNSNDQRTNEIDNLILSTKRKGGCEPKDIIEEYFDYLPRFIRDDLCNGPLSRCENVRCKKPIFDFVYYEFCVEKLILIEATEDIILSAAFCSKSCAEAWKPGKAILHWKFV
ncbi:uncharacterized protein LOC126773827 isoform X2 [Nymphalis io]|uniref:uncharacterized protein LOC126773827 isoform X2 n=1 Tax=Inachis io TaxID=171585 RepID=UPI00216A83C9|nr:uncharacterized protein LOC126773827 isoform X2 [Nymphalis io]